MLYTFEDYCGIAELLQLVDQLQIKCIQFDKTVSFDMFAIASQCNCERLIITDAVQLILNEANVQTFETVIQCKIITLEIICRYQSYPKVWFETQDNKYICPKINWVIRLCGVEKLILTLNNLQLKMEEHRALELEFPDLNHLLIKIANCH